VTGTVSNALQIRAFDGASWSAAYLAPWAPFNVNVSVTGSSHLASGVADATVGSETTINNVGTLEVAPGTTLHVDASSITNSGNILVHGTLVVEVPTLTFNEVGTVTLADGTIEGSASGELLYNAGNTILGAGTIGDGSDHLALDNASGMIGANGGTLILDTGATIVNAGILEAADGAYLNVRDSVVSMAGSVTIGAAATMEFAAAASGSVTFDGPPGTLRLDDSSKFSGHIFSFTGNGNPTSSDQIDLKNIVFGAGTTASYTGGPTGGTLTVSDAEHHTSSISLAGDNSNTTFSVSSDGDGGTSVFDQPVTQGDLAHGTFTFKEPDPTGNVTTLVSEQNAASGYVGTFTIDAAISDRGQQLVGWHFDLDPNSIVQTTAQTYDVTAAAVQPNGTNILATQSITVIVGGPGNDNFVFRPGFGADIIANAKSTDTIELDGFSSVASINELQMALNDVKTGHAQPLFQETADGHDVVISLDNHDTITLQNVQLANLNASNFIIH
jgi:hypothetical protein